MIIDGIDFVNLENEDYWSPSNKAEKNNLLGLAKNFIFSDDFIGARKVDGHHYRFIKANGQVKLQGRNMSTVTNDYVNKIEWVPHLKEIFEKLPDGTVFLGEIFFPKMEGSKHVTTIMGCGVEKAVFRQKNDLPKLHYYIFDILAWNGKSLLNTTLESRVNILNTHVKECLDFINPNKYINIATFYTGQKLWDYVGWALANGYEGVVIQRKDSYYSPGARTARKSLKIKKEIRQEIDAFLTGNIKQATREYEGIEPENWKYWLNTRTGQLLEGEENYDEYIKQALIIPVTKDFYFGLPSSVEFGLLDKDGRITPICWISNLTDELKWEIKESPTNCKGKVAKITGMEIDDKTGSLRHSKIKEWRADGDKTMSKCTISQIEK